MAEGETMAIKEGFEDVRYVVEDVYEVAREKVREYSAAVHNRHPAHHDTEAARALGYDGVVAPPTFVAIFGVIAQSRLLELGEMDITRVMQTDQRIVYHQPLIDGMRLDCEVSIESVRQIAGADIIVSKNLVTDRATGEPVLTTYTTVVHREAADGDEEPDADVMAMVRRTQSKEVGR